MEHYGTLYSLNFHSLLLARKQWPGPGEGRGPAPGTAVMQHCSTFTSLLSRGAQ